MENGIFPYVISGGQLVLSAALAYFTYHLWCSTKTLAQQSELSRKYEKTPRLTAKLQLVGADSQYIELVICNVGKGSAFDVSFKLVGMEENRETYGICLRGNEAPINFMIPNETVSYGFCALKYVRPEKEKYPKGIPSFQVCFDYKDSDGDSREDVCSIDIRQYAGVTWWGQPHEGGDTTLSDLTGPKSL